MFPKHLRSIYRDASEMLRPLRGLTQVYLKELNRFGCKAFDPSPFSGLFGPYWRPVPRYVVSLAQGSEASEASRGDEREKTNLFFTVTPGAMLRMLRP
jgi:hypothetical protein